MKKVFAFFLIFLSLVFFVSAENFDWIGTAQSALLDVNVSAGVNLQGTVTDLRVNLTTYPLSTEFQSIQSMISKPEADNFIFYWENPESNRVEFRVDSRIRSFDKIKPVYSKTIFPVKNLDAEYKQYTAPSELIDSGNSLIVAKAAELASGETDQYKVVHKIGIWIKQNIEYDLNETLIFSSQSASWTIQNKRAVCDEMSTLFIALNRAMGIPARFVSGVAFTNDPRFRKGWGPHAWAEVYFPGQGWVPFDVTYGQMGDVDLTHIELRKGPDVTTSSAYYSWFGGGAVQPEALDVSVKFVSADGKKQSPVSLNASMVEPYVGFGSYDLFEVDLKNNQNYYVPAELYVAASDIITIMGDTVNYVLLEPNEEKKLFWIVKVSDDLESKYIYTAFLSAGTASLNDTAKLEIRQSYEKFSLEQMQSRLDSMKEEDKSMSAKEISVNCDYKSKFYIDEEQKIKCSLFNTGNTNFDLLKVCIDKDCRTTDLKINQQTQVEFLYNATSVGKQAIAVDLKAVDFFKSEKLNVEVLQRPVVAVDVISPGTANFDDKFEIKITASRKEVPVSGAYLKLMLNNKLVSEQNIAELPQQYIVEMKGSQLLKGANALKAQVEYSDSEGNKYTKTAEFTIQLQELNLLQSVLYFFIHLFG
jgi:transglutaminase-like putative cysteine protease